MATTFGQFVEEGSLRLREGCRRIETTSGDVDRRKRKESSGFSARWRMRLGYNKIRPNEKFWTFSNERPARRSAGVPSPIF
jgi:hypothetical protein